LQEAEKAAYQQAMQVSSKHEVPTMSVAATQLEQHKETPMDVESSSVQADETRIKRKAEDEPDTESNKKPKFGKWTH
jgi:hypothetical protein